MLVVVVCVYTEKFCYSCILPAHFWQFSPCCITQQLCVETGRYHKEYRSGVHRRAECSAGDNSSSEVRRCVQAGIIKNNFSTLPWTSATHQMRQQYLMVNAEVKEDEDDCLPSLQLIGGCHLSMQLKQLQFHVLASIQTVTSKRFTFSRFNSNCPLARNHRKFPGN